MKEAYYLAVLSLDIEKEIGGKVTKIADKSTLGLPDSIHCHRGLATFIETKISEGRLDPQGKFRVQPWRAVKKDVRQFEVCRDLSKNALVLYAIYYPDMKMSAILTIPQLVELRGKEDFWLNDPHILGPGRGLSQIKHHQEVYRREVLGRIG
jgi:hypothetical protein